MTVAEFIAKWRKVELKERSAAQEHFLDLCNVFDNPTPAAADPTGESYCFEKGAAKHGGGDGFADMWRRAFYMWEYKGKHKDLNAAYDQLLRYRDAAESPPLLICCDLDRIVIHTNFTGTVSATHDIPLEALAEPRNIEIMRAVFHDPGALRPGRTSTAVTKEAAEHFAVIADAMRKRGLDPAAVAHFLDRIVFCLFAEDTGLLPDMVFTRIVEKSGGDPARFGKLLGQLFDTMATGGDFGLEPIRHFNGNLFDDPPSPGGCGGTSRTVLELDTADVKRIAAAASLDWSAVDPSIFGTLFERGLDPAKRSQLGAHFTSKEDIELVVDAVVMTVLRREWDECRQVIENLLTTGRKTGIGSRESGIGERQPEPPITGARLRKARTEAGSILHRFLTRLQNVSILDPACGSGNFLYVALLRLKDLEKQAILFGSDNGLGAFLPMVGPWQLHGIEVNAYAHDLAQMTVWIGWLQWIRANGFGFPADPVLRPLSENIRLMDAILGSPIPDARLPIPDAVAVEPEWPKVDFIVGNPPFLGDKLMRRELGDAYVERLRGLYDGRIPGQSDLCCYWFEKARAHIAAGKCKRAGLLATQGIRGGANREVLKRIKDGGDIFWAESDRPWILNGANVHVSMIAFDNGEETTRMLDGKAVSTVNADLTAAADVASSRCLHWNRGVSFIGTTKKAPLDIDDSFGLGILSRPNPHGKPSSDVVRPWMNGLHITRREPPRWIIDYPMSLSEADASLYEAPFEYVVEHVRPLRTHHREAVQAKYWWRQARPSPEMQQAVSSLVRYVATPRVSKHRIMSWVDAVVVPDCQIVVFARSDNLFFGVLHSRFHEVWALAQGTQLREKESGFRYTPSTCFETFPFPAGVLHPEYPLNPTLDAIAFAAKELNELREGWLNPSEWTRTEVLEFRGTVGGPWDRYIVRGSAIGDRESGSELRLDSPAPDSRFPISDTGTVRYPRVVARDAECAARLKNRTLTKLYNERPAWLATCHARLDAAVAAAYGWPADLSDDAILERLLELNLAQTGDGA